MYRMGDTASDRAQKGYQGQSDSFGPYRGGITHTVHQIPQKTPNSRENRENRENCACNIFFDSGFGISASKRFRINL